MRRASIEFVVGGNPLPVEGAGDFSGAAGFRLRVRLPSFQSADWTDADCHQGYDDMASQWSMMPRSVIDLLHVSGIWVSREAFYQYMSSTGCDVPEFWRQPPPDAIIRLEHVAPIIIDEQLRPFALDEKTMAQAFDAEAVNLPAGRAAGPVKKVEDNVPQRPVGRPSQATLDEAIRVYIEAQGTPRPPSTVTVVEKAAKAAGLNASRTQLRAAAKRIGYATRGRPTKVRTDTTK